MLSALQIVMLASPLPATYGGAIDQWWRLSRLHEAGVRLWLHVFLSEGETEHTELSAMAERVFYYRRTRPLFTLLPFTVASRPAEPLLANLLTGPRAILFEGVHTTACLERRFPTCEERSSQVGNLRSQPPFRIFVRLHNVEWRYHLSLLRAAPLSPRAPYHLIEALRLWHYERHLPTGLTLLPINADDERWFRRRYPTADIRLMPPFLDTKSPVESAEAELPPHPFLLYHGNLTLPGNRRAARWLDTTLRGLPLVIAGRGAATAMRGCRATVISDPPEPLMKALIRHADIVLLPTLQSTGTELKLLVTLATARGHIMASPAMLHGNDHLRPLVHCPITPGAVLRLLATPPTPGETARRRKALRRCNDISAITDG